MTRAAIAVEIDLPGVDDWRDLGVVRVELHDVHRTYALTEKALDSSHGGRIVRYEIHPDPDVLFDPDASGG